MLDIAFIREHPDQVRDALVKLNTEAPVDEILELDRQRRELLQQVEALRAERNAGSKQIGGLMRDGRRDEAEALKGRMSQIGDEISGLDEGLRGVEASLYEKALTAAEGFGFEPLPHWDLGPVLGIIDFERGGKLSGSRFYLLRGAGARLQRALIQWMLNYHVDQHGYTEIYPPYMVRREMMVGAAQLPKFEENIYHDAEADYWFIGTAEIPLTNLHRDEILNAEQLPLNYVAYTACFRREKMSAGRDVRGIKRGHQFDKVEMYKLVPPETSYDELEKLLSDAEAICRELGIPYRVIEMCTGDLGFQAAKKYDLELWAPGCGEWLEVSSCSNCTDFQARRANIRFRREPGAKPEFVHTLNGSGLALPRVMIAIIENYQQSDGTIVVPEVLRPYMGGLEVIKEA
jgi:seryl-tRNA synthetase